MPAYMRSELESIKTGSGKMASSSVLAIVGGAFMVAGGLFAFALFGAWTSGGMPGWGPMMGGGGLSMMGGYFMGAVSAMAAISLVAGAVSIAGGLAIYKSPESSVSWGIGILAASIVGLFGMGGFVIGPILGIIGGALALAKK